MRRVGAKGQALTEFILVIPLFLVLFLGVIQFSRLYSAFQVVNYAAFAACRAAIVRPCAAFHPDDTNRSWFSPAPYAAAVYSMLAVSPPQEVAPTAPFDWIPALPDSDETEGLDFQGTGAGNELAENRFANAQSLTAVRRVYSTAPGVRPVVWTATDDGPGPGIPCADASGAKLGDDEQNVPPPGYDLTLEVVFAYPMTVPLVNRVIFGIFVNASQLARDMGVGEIDEDAMVYPTRLLAPFNRNTAIRQVLQGMANYFDYGNGSMGRMAAMAVYFAQHQVYPLPIRGRCTLTVEGAIRPLIGPG